MNAQYDCVILKRSVVLLITPVILSLVLLACGTVVTELPRYTCPTDVPLPTSTTLMGTPLPTLRPFPTPYIILPPQDFYVGDAIFVGQPNASVFLQFRLQQVGSQATPPLGGQPRSLYTWQLEVRNLGQRPYETIPVALMTISRLSTPTGVQTGNWSPSETAMRAAGFTHEIYDPVLPGTMRVYRLAAYAPAGQVRQLAYRLDGEGHNRITWVNASNPTCSGDVAA